MLICREKGREKKSMYYYTDLHSDTITQLHYPMEDLANNKRMVSIPDMEKGHTLIQCFSAFIPTGIYPKICHNTILWKRFQYITYKKDRLMEKHKDYLSPICSYNDIAQCISHNKIGVIYTIEDSGIYGNDIAKVNKAYNNGVRIATLTWNHENSLGYPNSTNPNIMKQGLKPFGFEVIEEMMRLGIIIDVSHLSDGGFYDVAKICKGPFIATHSNCRYITNHPRNLTDDMIKIIANHNGIIGLNFYPHFLKNDNSNNHSKIEYMIQHIKHIHKIGGLDVIAIGTDFDGIKGNLEIDTPAKMPLLFDALEKAGFSRSEIEKICLQNTLRVLKDCWK